MDTAVLQQMTDALPEGMASVSPGVRLIFGKRKRRQERKAEQIETTTAEAPDATANVPGDGDPESS